MRKEGFYIIYDADDEEPNCNACDNVSKGDVWQGNIKVDYCSTFCGGNNFWAKYERTERNDET